jgi:SAM-dependent methyltransferase
MAASIPWGELDPETAGEGLTVLDPMAGSGTSIVVARARGHHAIGIDADPLAVLISKVWSSDVPEGRVVLAKAEALLERMDWRSVAEGEAYPIGADDKETRDFVRYWFDPTCRRQLTALSRRINLIQDQGLRHLFWCALSRLIIVKQSGASRAMDVAHSRPHRVYDEAPLWPIDGFVPALRRILAAAPFRAGVVDRRPDARITLGDARDLPIDDDTVDALITSPPYLNAIDYLRGHRLSLVWMKHSVEELRRIRSASIGRERGTENAADAEIDDAIEASVESHDALPPQLRSIVTGYLQDMRQVLAETARVLKQSGRAIFVVGDCTTHGFNIRNSAAIDYLAAKVGLVRRARRTRPLPQNRRYLPPPQAKRSGDQLHKRMRREVILTFEPAAAHR